MLSLFPSALAFGQLGPFMLRVVLGIVLIYWALARVKKPGSALLSTLGLVEGLVGLLLIAGLFTQAAALITALILAAKLVLKIKTKSLFTDGVNYYFILFVIALSLFVLGAGAFAFDYPL